MHFRAPAVRRGFLMLARLLGFQGVLLSYNILCTLCISLGIELRLGAAELRQFEEEWS